MLVPDLMAVAWLLAWARVLACVTRWPPGCTLPTLPPLRLSHYYHICSTHPCLLISNPQLYHICQEMFHHFSLLLSQWEPLPSVLDFCNNLCCLHFVNIWNETGSIRTETLLKYNYTLSITQCIFRHRVFCGCCVNGSYIHDLINPYYQYHVLDVSHMNSIVCCGPSVFVFFHNILCNECFAGPLFVSQCWSR